MKEHTLISIHQLPCGLFTLYELICSCCSGAIALLKCIDHVDNLLGPVAQSVISLIADPGVASLILVRSNTFVEIDHEIFSKVILLLSLLSVASEGMCSNYWLTAY